MKKLLIVTLMTLAGAANAQQASPGEQALGAKLMQEMQMGLQCSASLISMKADLDKAVARIKELETAAKPEPENPTK